jgi:hypothetical protein
LTSPTVAAQHLFSEVVVGLGIKSDARLLAWDPIHESFSATETGLLIPSDYVNNPIQVL